jgi:transcriptional regulator with XRE-family HTH domain
MDKDSDNKPNSRTEKERGVSKTLEGLLRNFPGMAAQTFARAAGQSTNFVDMLLRAPEYMEHAGKAGRYLKDLREVAGLTVEDLGKAIEIENLDLLRAIEEGRSPITIDILFRLASFYSRNDPFTFMMDFSKTYAPWIWQILRFTGLEKLLITLERELKFINIYRSRDVARALGNQEFDKLVAFTQQSFDMALDLIADTSIQRKAATPPTPPAPEKTAQSADRASSGDAKAKAAPKRPPAIKKTTTRKKAAPRKSPAAAKSTRKTPRK